jgi:DNA-binding GntR family transcriptional regulator
LLMRDSASIGTGSLISVTSLANGYLHRAIMAGQCGENDVLRQEAIAEQLGASRDPVREALKQLESGGLVVQRPRRGCVVTSLDPAEIEDVFDVRVVLEERAAFLAAAKRGPRDVDLAETSVRAVHELGNATPRDFAAIREHHAVFHRTTLSASGRPRLMRAITMQSNLVERYVRIGASLRRHCGAVPEEHERIFSAFQAGDSALCASKTRRQARNSCQRLLEVLKDRRP